MNTKSNTVLCHPARTPLNRDQLAPLNAGRTGGCGGNARNPYYTCATKVTSSGSSTTCRAN